MKSLVDFTNEQLEIMSKESSPRGKNARYEIERRKSQHPLDQSDSVPQPPEKALTEDPVQDAETSVQAPKRTRKRTSKSTKGA